MNTYNLKASPDQCYDLMCDPLKCWLSANWAKCVMAVCSDDICWKYEQNMQLSS